MDRQTQERKKVEGWGMKKVRVQFPVIDLLSRLNGVMIESGQGIDLNKKLSSTDQTQGYDVPIPTQNTRPNPLGNLTVELSTVHCGTRGQHHWLLIPTTSILDHVRTQVVPFVWNVREGFNSSRTRRKVQTLRFNAK